MKEPVVQEGDLESHSGAPVADISARGVWQPQTTALFDVRVVDSDAPSYLSKPPAAVPRGTRSPSTHLLVNVVTQALPHSVSPLMD